MAGERFAQALARREVPQDEVLPESSWPLRRECTTRGQGLAIRAEGHAGHIAGVPVRGFAQALVRRYVPQDDAVAITPPEASVFPSGLKATLAQSRMTGERVAQALARRYVPQDNALHLNYSLPPPPKMLWLHRTRPRVLPSGLKATLPDTVWSMSLAGEGFAQALACRDVPQDDALVSTARGQRLAVRAEGHASTGRRGR